MQSKIDPADLKKKEENPGDYVVQKLVAEVNFIMNHCTQA